MECLGNIDAAALTGVFILVVAALTMALVTLFCVIERSPRFGQARVAMVRLVGGASDLKQTRRTDH